MSNLIRIVFYLSMLNSFTLLRAFSHPFCRSLSRKVDYFAEKSAQSDHFKEIIKATSIHDAFTIAKNVFEKFDIPDSDDSSRHLIMMAGNFGTKLSDFHSVSQHPLKEEVKQKFLQMVTRRLNREPIQYIIGEWDFYGRTFACEPPVLIPRPETEELVELILERLKQYEAVRILDIGSGTGAIGLSLLKELGVKCEQVTGIDISPQAVRLSKINADKILSSTEHAKFKCILSSISEFSRHEANFCSYDIVVSNPPYIPSKVIADLQPEIVNFEDKVALDGGNDGLNVVREILSAGRKLLSPNGTREIWLEVSEVHPEQIKELCADSGITRRPEDDIFSHYECLEAIRDFSGNFRFSRLRLINDI